MVDLEVQMEIPVCYNKLNILLGLRLSQDARLDEELLSNKYPESIFIENKITDTQGFILKDIDNNLIISFRGTQQIKDLLTDFNAWQQVIPYGNYHSKIRVHAGVLSAYKSVRGTILEHVSSNKHNIDDIYITGHSLGGALAIFCAVDIQYNYNLKPIVYISGNPAVGNKEFVRSYNKRVPDTIRTYLKKDIVPKLPPWWFQLKYGGYSHVDHPNPIGPNNFWTGLKLFFTFRKDFFANLANHSIDLYKKYC